MQKDQRRQALQAFRGRIGVAKRVHAIENSYAIGDGSEFYGTSLCKKWAGLCRFTTEEVSCWDCKKAIADWASRLSRDLANAGEAEYGRPPSC